MRDDGKEFLIDNETWKIPSDGLEGWDYITPAVNTIPNAFSDGSTLSSKRVNEQDRTVTAVLQNKNLNSVMRQVVRSFFGVKRTFKVDLTYQNMTRWCEGEIIAFQMPTENIHKKLQFTFTILSTQPYLLSVEEFGRNIAETTPRFGFPYVSLLNRGFIFSVFNFAKEVELSNDGDVETYARIVMIARGDVTNPEIKNGDYYIKILDTMKNSDVIEIDLVNSPPTVMKNGANIIGRTSRDSSFENMKFQVGTNKVSFDADIGSNVLDVYIYYNKRYGGM